MSEENQYFDNPEADSVVISDTAEFSGPAGYETEQNFEINGEIASPEVFEFSLADKKEWELLNPEEKTEATGLIQEAILLANVESTGNEEAEKAAQVSSLGTALAFAETPSSDDENRIDGEDDGENPSFVKHIFSKVYETAGKGARVAALAATLGIAAITPMKSASAGGIFGNVSDRAVQETMNKVDRVFRGAQDVQGTQHEQRNNNMRIRQLERQKEELARRNATDTRYYETQANAEIRQSEIQAEATQKALRAQLKMERAQADADFRKNGDRARYEAKLSQLDVKEAQIDAQREISRVSIDARVANANQRIDRNAGHVEDKIDQIEMTQEDIDAQRPHVELQRTRSIWETVRDVFHP